MGKYKKNFHNNKKRKNDKSFHVKNETPSKSIVRTKSFYVACILVFIVIILLTIGILNKKEDLILCAGIFSFFYSVLTFDFVRTKISNKFKFITGISIDDEHYVILVSFCIALLFCAFVLPKLKEIPAPIRLLEISNFGNLLMGLSIIFLYIDKIFIPIYPEIKKVLKVKNRFYKK